MALPDQGSKKAPGQDSPVVIEVRDLHKAFRIPTHRIDTLKEQFANPFAGREYRDMKALDGISFDIRQGEFFGIVGRNGSGKSTLLKLLASIYQADSGSIRMAGRLAPFIELGVGFNMELTARENVVLNGVMMGLTPNEARSRLDAVLAFSELEKFVDLKLKNYSSGMLVRLAFAVMLEADADILLIDEVLAVGDAAFQQKCADAFHAMKNVGKTIILVTHEMGSVEAYCDRAMLIEGGNIQHIGDPGEVGRRYLRTNFGHDSPDLEQTEQASSEELRLEDAWIETDEGQRTSSIEHGHHINLHFNLALREALPGLKVGFSLANADGVSVFQSFAQVVPQAGSTELVSGQHAQVKVRVNNPLSPGRYFIHLGVNPLNSADSLLYVENCIDFVVFGDPAGGVVSIAHEIAVEVGRNAR